jgi:hypothetical protein
MVAAITRPANGYYLPKLGACVSNGEPSVAAARQRRRKQQRRVGLAPRRLVEAAGEDALPRSIGEAPAQKERG